MRPRLLDLFCGAGGAAMGYSRAGFDVVGVDIRPQPHYPFEFWQGDALAVLRCGHFGPWERPMLVAEFDAIHASPPCQAFSITRNAHPLEEYADLLTPTLALLESVALPWVVENVRGAPLDGSLMLCGSMFGLRVRRHRYFRVNWPLPALIDVDCAHRADTLDMYSSGANRNGTERQYVDEMGVTWAPVRTGNRRYAGTECIPPAYSEWIGSQLIRQLVTAQREGVA